MKYTYADYQKFCQEKYLAFGTTESLIAYYDGMTDFAEKFRASDVALQYRLRESGLMRDAVVEQTLECLIEMRASMGEQTRILFEICDTIRLLRGALELAPDGDPLEEEEGRLDESKS